MRLVSTVLLCALLAACGARGSQGPAWPKMAETEDDGGESLAPRQPTVIAEVSKAEPEATEEEAAPAAAEATPTPAETEPITTTTDSTVITAPEEVINIDDIVIEIEDE